MKLYVFLNIMNETQKQVDVFDVCTC